MLLWLNSALFAKILDFKANLKKRFGSHLQIAENTKKQILFIVLIISKSLYLLKINKESFFYILFKERIF